VSRPAISKHLRVLLDAGILTARKEGRERRYAIVPGPLREAAARVRALDAFWADGVRRLGEYLAEDGGPSAPPR
jgi:DNA-binding transcriptional ArsR family regulator